MVLINLFIGLMCSAMIDSFLALEAHDKMEIKVNKLMKVNHLPRSLILKYREIFDFLDVTKTERIGRVELQYGLRLNKMQVMEKEVNDTFKEVDTDKSQYIEFGEFVVFMLRMHHDKYEKKLTIIHEEPKPEPVGMKKEILSGLKHNEKSFRDMQRLTKLAMITHETEVSNLVSVPTNTLVESNKNKNKSSRNTFKMHANVVKSLLPIVEKPESESESAGIVVPSHGGSIPSLPPPTPLLPLSQLSPLPTTPPENKSTTEGEGQSGGGSGGGGAVTSHTPVNNGPPSPSPSPSPSKMKPHPPSSPNPFKNSPFKKPTPENINKLELSSFNSSPREISPISSDSLHHNQIIDTQTSSSSLSSPPQRHSPSHHPVIKPYQFISNTHVSPFQSPINALNKFNSHG